MVAPVEFTIRLDHALWRLERDGEEQAAYSHVEQATHDAVRRARTLQESGSPATVALMMESGGRLEIDVEPQAANPDLAHGAEAFTPSKPL